MQNEIQNDLTDKFSKGTSGIATMMIGGYGDALQTGDLTLIKANEEIGPLKRIF